MKVTIDNQTLELKSSALTLLKFKELFNEDLYDVLVAIEEKQIEIAEAKETPKNTTSFIIEHALKMAYTMSDLNVGFEEWLSSMGGVLDDSKWINEVLRLATGTFRRNNTP